MAGDFISMVTRITSELRRSNLTTEAKAAINDAIAEAGKTRFYLNEVRAQSFQTVAGQEYYPDTGLVQIDALYYVRGNTRYNLTLVGDDEMNDLAEGNPVGGQLEIYSHTGQSLRFYPIPSVVYNVYADGYGKLTPWPMVNDDDSNNWMTEGERYIRALAKSIMLKDVIRDYKEASALELIAEDLKDQLVADTTLRQTTNTIRGTQF